MVGGVAGQGKGERFAAPPWTSESAEWQALDRRLPADHLARRVRRAVGILDLAPLLDSYLGVGKKALPPDLLLQAVLYEMQSKRPSPAQWARDVRESEPLRWLLFGLEPSRARLYDFRDRLAPFLAEWHAQVLHLALEEGITPAARVALDSSTVAAQASRRRLLKDERLQQRRQVIDEALRRAERGQPVPAEPAWLARTAAGLRAQKRRYRQAAEVMRQRQRANAGKRSGKRKPADKVLVSATEPAAVLARDKEGVFRPLYNVQLLRDLDSPLVLGYGVLAQNNDNGALGPMVEGMNDTLGRKPEVLLVDAGFVSLQHLEFCRLHGITVYGPCQENDYSAANGKRPQSNQHTQLPKGAFTWLEQEQTYRCPEGHRLRFTRKETQKRSDHAVTLSLYTCPAEHCRACPRQPACTPNPDKGRTVSRMENEELLDTLRGRMATAEAKQLYKLRSRTVELNYADLKEHRGVRRLHGRGLVRAAAEIGALILIHNLLAVDGHRQGHAREPPANRKTAPTPCAA
jgi:transposase